MKEEIKNLIDAAITDGFISDLERQVIMRKGIVLGEDPDEITIYIDAALQKAAMAQTAAARKARGPKCPNCGALVEPLAVRCSTCGYEFKQVEVRDSVKELAAKLEEFDMHYVDKPLQKSMGESLMGKLVDTSASDKLHLDMRRAEAKGTIIQNFPVPRAKEDLFDFAVSMQSQWQSTSSMDPSMRILKNAYKAKYDECVNKAKMLYPNDPIFAGIFEQHSKDKKKLGFYTKYFLIYGGILVLLWLFIFWGIKCSG